MKRSIAVVTGSRADYGLLRWVMHEVSRDPAFALQTVVTGTHLAPEFGFTARAIEADGFTIEARVDMLLAGDSAWSAIRSLGLATLGFADAFERLAPHLVLLLGDRYELLAAAQAALIARIPLAHVAGGDITEGAFDDSVRHGITKMAQIHFVTNEDAARRVRQMGEDPAHIHMVGSPGIDGIRLTPKLSRADLEREIGFELRRRNVLVTFHPPTLDRLPAAEQFAEVLAALDRLGSEVGLLFTQPNADPSGRELGSLCETFVAAHANATMVRTLGQQGYYSAVAACDAVVGNSSSGLYEVPSLGRPTVNVGTRQDGRLRASSVIDCAVRAADIERAMRRAFKLDCSNVHNPYGDGHSAERIVAVLRAISDFEALVRKRFFLDGS